MLPNGVKYVSKEAALADMKLEGTDPVSRVVKGAYVAAHRSSTPDQMQMAKSWWEEATLGGADVTHLMPFLTDSYDLAKDFDKLKGMIGLLEPGAIYVSSAKPFARVLPIDPPKPRKRWKPHPELADIPFQHVPSEVYIAEDRERDI